MLLAIFELAPILLLPFQHIHSWAFSPLHVSLAVWLSILELPFVVSYALVLIFHHTIAPFAAINEISAVNVA